MKMRTWTFSRRMRSMREKISASQRRRMADAGGEGEGDLPKALSQKSEAVLKEGDQLMVIAGMWPFQPHLVRRHAPRRTFSMMQQQTLERLRKNQAKKLRRSVWQS